MRHLRQSLMAGMRDGCLAAGTGRATEAFEKTSELGSCLLVYRDQGPGCAVSHCLGDWEGEERAPLSRQAKMHRALLTVKVEGPIE